VTSETKKFIGVLTSVLMGLEQRLLEQEHVMLATRDLETAVECSIKADTVHEIIGTVYAEAKRFQESEE
jgi:hypothetical protein